MATVAPWRIQNLPGTAGMAYERTTRVCNVKAIRALNTSTQYQHPIPAKCHQYQLCVTSSGKGPCATYHSIHEQTKPVQRVYKGVQKGVRLKTTHSRNVMMDAVQMPGGKARVLDAVGAIKQATCACLHIFD
jgi:hypothetical protein